MVKFKEKTEICRDLFHGFDYTAFLTGGDLEKARMISGGVNFLLGKSVAEIEVDEIDRMTVRDLRKKIREAKKEREALENVIKSKNEKLDELEKEIALKERSDEEPVEVPAAPPMDARLLGNEIETLVADSFDLYRKLTSLADRLESATSGDDRSDSSYRMLFGRLKGTASSIAEEMERALEYVESRVPASLTAVSGFDFMSAADEEEGK